VTVPFNPYLAVGCLAGLLLVSRAARVGTWQPARIAGFLESSFAPPVFGLLTMFTVWFVWRSLGEPGVIHDERAYLLQAEIFARGHWTAPRPPIAAFFEQMHVFVDPAVFAKYPPAHALMLVPGIWLGMPGLMPAVLAGVAGALTFWLARRLSNVWTALLTWLLWTTAPVTLMWATSYLSESTTTVMWLAAASATVRWLDSERPAWLITVAATVAWGLDARPLTMLALAAPLGVVIVRRLIETGNWRTAAIPVVVGTALLSIGPVWNQQTLGDWARDPYPLYSRTYFPFDKPGFGVDSALPLRPLPSELLGMDAWSRDIHAAYVPSAVPVAFAQRIQALLSSVAIGWRVLICALLIASLPRARGPARLAVVSSVCLLVAYLTFAHPPGWVVYYFELLPALHFLAAANLVRLLGQSKQRLLEDGPSVSTLVARSSALAALLFLPFCASDLVQARTTVDLRNEFNRRAADVIRRAPPHSILFVRYPPSHSPHRAITRNEVDLRSARSWVVHDRGADNERLLRLAPDRQPYVLDASTFQLEPLSPSSGGNTARLRP
jgi:dolichyl-phosphate-mannose-protein mannosyltransferase